MCSHSPNDVPPEPQRNVSIAAVRGAVRPSKSSFVTLFLCYMFSDFLIKTSFVFIDVSTGTRCIKFNRYTFGESDSVIFHCLQRILLRIKSEKKKNWSNLLPLTHSYLYTRKRVIGKQGLPCLLTGFPSKIE